MTEPIPSPSIAPRRSFKRSILFFLLPFLLGVGGMGWAVLKWEPVRSFILGDQNGSAGPSEVAKQDSAPAVSQVPIPAIGSVTREEGLMLAAAARRLVDNGETLITIEPALNRYFGTSLANRLPGLIAASRQPATLDQLRDELRASSQALGNPASSLGLIERVRHFFSTLVVVRYASTAPNIPESDVERAIELVEAGQVEQALAIVEKLPGAQQILPWREKARNYISTRAIIGQMELIAINTPQQQIVPAAPVVISP